MPVLTLVLVLTPYITRMVRANVREVLQQPMVRSAVLRGLPPRQVMWRHVVPNASLPVDQRRGAHVRGPHRRRRRDRDRLRLPGHRQPVRDSVLGKDIPIVQAVTLVIGAGFVVLNLLADVVLAAARPAAAARPMT